MYRSSEQVSHLYTGLPSQVVIFVYVPLRIYTWDGFGHDHVLAVGAVLPVHVVTVVAAVVQLVRRSALAVAFAGCAAQFQHCHIVYQNRGQGGHCG